MALQPLIISQKDGVPPHVNLAVQGFVKQTFPGFQNGPLLWPSSLADSALLNFFLGGCMEFFASRTPVLYVDSL
jgi:hypothetical protein